MKLWSIGVGVLIAMPVLAQGTTQHPTHNLDLLVQKPTDERVSRIGLPRDGVLKWHPPPPPADSGPVPRFPFQVTLLSTDRPDYAIGDEIVFTLRLTNISGESFAFPWSVEPGPIRPETPGARILVLNFVVIRSASRRQEIGFHTVYGSQEVPGTLRMIGPGETVEIRAGAALKFQRWSPRTAHPWIEDAKLRASVLLASRESYYPPGISENEIVVQLAR
jgi:hypothetical protein